MVVYIHQISQKRIKRIQRIAKEAYFHAYEEIHSREQNEFSFSEMYSKESLLNQFENLGSKFFIGITEKHTIGYMSLIEEEDGMWLLDKLYLYPSEIGKGLGGSFISFAEKFVKEKGGKAIRLKVNRRNKAVSFYKHMGFSITGQWDLPIADAKWTMDGYDMLKKLN